MTDGWALGVLAPAFRDFYTCLSDLGAEIEVDPWHSSSRAGDTPEARAAAQEQAAARVRNRLRSFLQSQAADLGRRLGTDGESKLDDAQYVMASLADEVFLNLDWEGREFWAHNLLETHMFGSHVAGERVFERAEALLGEGDELDDDLALVYLSAISLGFLGKFRGAADTRPLQHLRRRLLSTVMRGASALGDDLDPLVPQAMEHTLAANESLRLPPVRRWATVLVVMIVAYLFVAHWVWVDLSAGLRAESQDVAAATAAARGRTP
jgi:type VI secretion system protein ImpK